MNRRHLAILFFVIALLLALSSLAFLYNGMRKLQSERAAAAAATKPSSSETSTSEPSPETEQETREPVGDPTPSAEPPPAPGTPAAAAHDFISSILAADFRKARASADPASVSDAKLAGLCIIFEEGQYMLRPTKPLRTMFQRGDTTGLLASVTSADGHNEAAFTMTLRDPGDGWKIHDINLDKLLADYAARNSDGADVHFSPLIKNPKGGDTVGLYFGFDDDQMTPRTRRQLEIVAAILRADPGKKLTLTGYTDSMGTEEYNMRLSASRAESVSKFLIAAGVPAANIHTVARGSSRPLMPNTTPEGEDDPSGRRANRRTEIHLDF